MLTYYNNEPKVGIKFFNYACLQAFVNNNAYMAKLAKFLKIHFEKLNHHTYLF